VKLILETYKSWKRDIVDLRKDQLEKVDKLLKYISAKGENNLWIEVENSEFEKVMLNKIITNKYFTNNYIKF
jgi:hypothetical protein